MSNFTKAWNKFLAGIEPALERAVDAVAKEIQENAERSTLFKGTGALRSSIRILPAGMLSRKVLADKDYAWYVEFGNDHHGPYIYPKGRALRFTAGGSTVFARRVRSYKGRRFMETAAKQAEPNVEALVGAELKKLV